MAWRIELSTQAQRDLRDLDRQDVRRILRFLSERVARLEDPRSIANPLKGARLGGLWRYRVGSYRLIATIEEDCLRVLILRVGHRREVYRP